MQETQVLGDWNTKVGSQEISGVTGKFDFGVHNEAGQRLTEFCQKNALVLVNTLPTTKEMTLHNTKIKQSLFFAAKDGDALYSQQKQDRELTVAQIMNSLLPNSDSNRRKWGKPLDHSGMTSIHDYWKNHSLD